MTAYFGLWGMNASAAEAFKEAPYTMVVTLKVQILNNGMISLILNIMNVFQLFNTLFINIAWV